MTRRSVFKYLREIAEILVLTFAIFFVVQTFVAQPYQIRQDSMESTLEPDQFVLVDKLTPRFDAYKRGDIVVFAPPDSWARAGTPFIKRVIGLGGDVVEIRDGHVVVNGADLAEPYLFQVDGQAQPTIDSLGPGSWTVPAGELFLMGDHRAVSEDSRAFGTVPTDHLIGRAWLRYWPVGVFGILPRAAYEEPSPRAP
jgi:signal peptidase I